MCGLVGYVGSVDQKLIDRLVEESTVRGLHHLGRKIMPKAGIYHTRYCTSGGDHQPIQVGKKWIAMNGVVDMGTKPEMEKRWNLKLSTDNDAEIALLHTTSASRIDYFLRLKVSIAALVLTPTTLKAFRNEERPLWMHEDKRGSIILASTKDIFNRAGVRTNLHQLEPYKVYEWIL